MAGDELKASGLDLSRRLVSIDEGGDPARSLPLKIWR